MKNAILAGLVIIAWALSGCVSVKCPTDEKGACAHRFLDYPKGK